MNNTETTENMLKNLDINRTFHIKEENVDERRAQANLQIITKINCDFKLHKDKVAEIVQQAWQLEYLPEGTLVFRGKEKNIFVFKLQSRSDVLYPLSNNLWGVGPFVIVVQQYLLVLFQHLSTWISLQCGQSLLIFLLNAKVDRYHKILQAPWHPSSWWKILQKSIKLSHALGF